MTTPLMFHGFQLLEAFTSCYLYPHIIHFSLDDQKWIALNKSSRQLLPFYISLFVVYIGFAISSCLFVIFKYIFISESHISGILFGFILTLFIGSVAEWGICIPAINNAVEMVEYINALVCLEKAWFPNESEQIQSSKSSWKPAVKLVYVEFANFLAGRKVDYTGVIITAISCPFQVVRFLVVPVLVNFNYDPFLYGFQGLGLENNMLLVVTRLFIGWVVVLSTFRTTALIGGPLLLEHCVYNRIIRTFHNSPLTDETVRFYRYTCIVQNAGETFIRYAISAYLVAGFIILLTFTVCIGWKLLPMPLYILSVPTAVVIIGSVHNVFSLGLDSHDRSKHMLKTDWPLKLLKSVESSRSKVIMRRIIKTARPIIFRSMGMSSPLNPETRITYYANVLTRTADLILLFQENNR